MPTYPYSLTLTNPGAETGDITGWTNLQGTLTATTTQGGTTPRTGTYFFFAGAVLATKAYQDVSIPSELETDVDSGGLIITAAGYHSGFTDDDGGWLGVWPLDSSDRRIGAEIKSNFIHDGVNAWTLRSCTGRLPEGTRKLRFTQYGWRGTGTNLDSYWDDLSLTVTRSTEAIRQTVNGAIFHDRFQWPTGTLPDPPWNIVSGTWTVHNSGIPSFFSSVRETSGGTNRIAVYDAHDAQGPMVVQSQINNITGSGVGPGVIARSNSAADTYYNFVSSSAADTIRLFKKVSAVETLLDTQSVTQDAGIEYELKTYFADGVQKCWVDGVLIVNFNDTTHDGVTGYGGLRVNSTVPNEARFDEYSVLRSNSVTCSNLPTGYKFRVTGPIIDGGVDTTKVATESGGTATVDCDNLWFPANKVEILTSGDVVVETLSQLVWGGDQYAYAADVNLTAGLGEGSGEGFTPTVVPGYVSLTAGLGEGSGTGFAPTLSLGAGVVLTAGLGEGSGTGFAPAAFIAGIGVVLTAGLGTGSGTGFAPVMASYGTLQDTMVFSEQMRLRDGYLANSFRDRVRAARGDE